MKAALLSEKPKWAELIANGKKKYDVRKTRPKIDTPFNVFIYCTYGDSRDNYCLGKRGKVIGEFVCDEIYDIKPTLEHYSDGYDIDDDMLAESCLNQQNLKNYGKGATLYFWHISDLKIYDKPRELSDFIKPSNGCCNEGKCKGCKFFDIGIDGIIEDDCLAEFDTDSYSIVKRPPQSWCYVEYSEVK